MVFDGSSSKVSVLTTLAAWKKLCGSVNKMTPAYAGRPHPTIENRMNQAAIQTGILPRSHINTTGS